MTDRSGKSILFVSHDATRAGAQMVLLHLLRWLKENSPHTCRVLLRNGGPLVPDFEAVALTKVIENKNEAARRTRFSRFVGKIKRNVFPYNLESDPTKLIGPHRPALIYSNTITNGVVVDRLRRDGTPVLTHVHEMSYWIEKSGPTNWESVKRQTTKFISASRATKTNLVEKFGLSESAIEVVHEFIPEISLNPNVSNGLRKQFNIPPSALIVGGSGHESWRKGRDLFVQVAATVRRLAGNREIHFVWVGYSGDREDQFRLAHDARLAGVSDQVHWAGEVANPLPYFQEMDVFTLLSREDPFPLVCLEAGMMGKPIVCFDRAGGIPELVEDDCGFTVEYLNIPAVAECLLQLAIDPFLVQRLGMRAREKIIERHTVRRVGPRVLGIIEKLIAGPLRKSALEPFPS